MWGKCLAGIRNNILCFADDVCLLSPCPQALQVMLDVLHQEISKLKLTINVEKCAFLVFKSSKYSIDTSKMYLHGSAIKRVKCFKYLGIMLSEDMNVKHDIDRSSAAFLKQFNGMYYKFHDMSSDVMNFLFKTFTNSFYGIETWYDGWKNPNIKNIAITYHKAVKKTAHMNVWDSNHIACEVVGVPIFKHLLSKRIVCFYFSILKTESPCLSIYKHYFKYQSFINHEVDAMLNHMYDISLFRNNPLCAILARIGYVERNEPRSHYLPGGQEVGDLSTH